MEQNFKITGTMIGTILGLNPWETPKDLFLKLKGLVPTTENDYMKIGKFYEPYLISYYDQTKKVVTKKNIYIEKDAFAGHLDALTDATVVESKTTHRPVENLLPVWNAQVQWYMMLTELEQADVIVAKLPEYSYEKIRYLQMSVEPIQIVEEIKLFRVQRDDDWLKIAVDYAKDFLEILNSDTFPEDWNIEPDIRFRLSLTNSSIEATEDICIACQQIVDLTKALKELETAVETKKKLIKDFMKDKELLTYKGKVIATWKSQERTTLDIQSLKEQQPETYEKFVKTNTIRVFKANGI